jgi:hypothetical protein
MKYIEPHAHMVSRVTDDYQKNGDRRLPGHL